MARHPNTSVSPPPQDGVGHPARQDGVGHPLGPWGEPASGLWPGREPSPERKRQDPFRTDPTSPRWRLGLGSVVPCLRQTAATPGRHLPPNLTRTPEGLSSF